MRKDLAAEIPKITADRVQLQQVLMNLMLNAIEAMREMLEDGRLLISVSETGVGLPAEKADQIFNAFFTTKPQGSGMGLAITRSIVESHGGRLGASANDGPGDYFADRRRSIAGTHRNITPFCSAISPLIHLDT